MVKNGSKYAYVVSWHCAYYLVWKLAKTHCETSPHDKFIKPISQTRITSIAYPKSSSQFKWFCTHELYSSLKWRSRPKSYQKKTKQWCLIISPAANTWREFASTKDYELNPTENTAAKTRSIDVIVKREADISTLMSPWITRERSWGDTDKVTGAEVIEVERLVGCSFQTN